MESRACVSVGNTWLRKALYLPSFVMIRITLKCKRFGKDV